MRRALSVLVCLSAALATAVAAPGPTAAEGPVLDRPRHGADAVRALGDRLPAVAAAHQTTARTLRDRLHHDASLWVDVEGGLFYIDEAPAAAEEGVAGPGTSAGSTPPTASEVFALHSLPRALRTVYLDFDGVGGSWGGTIGGAWSRSYTGGDGVAEPYSLDATLGSFSADERADIYSTWQRVAEDFAPFAINVTTQDPGFAAIDRSDPDDQTYGTRVAITSTATSCGCGGVAYVGVFDRLPSGNRDHGYSQPAFVYNEGAKYAAEAATHEAGHTLGLSHDGTSSIGYYAGHGDWAPLMGVGYHRPITQWSRGEYAGANNSEDDFAVAATNGGPPIADAAGTSLVLGEPAIGTIGTAGDADEFTLTLAASTPVTIAIEPSLVSPNLDVQATLTPASGDTPGFTDPSPVAHSSDVVGGLGSSLTAVLDAGTYTVTVTGRGFGAPSTDGYSGYGSLGGYTVTAATAPTTAAVPSVPGSFAAAAGTDGTTVGLSWTDITGETSYALERYSVASDGVSTLNRTQPVAADRQSFTDSPGVGTWRYRINAVNPTGSSTWTDSAAVTLAAPRKGGRK